MQNVVNPIHLFVKWIFAVSDGFDVVVIFFLIYTLLNSLIPPTFSLLYIMYLFYSFLSLSFFF